MRRFGRLHPRGIHPVRATEKGALVLGAFACAAVLFLVVLTILDGPDLTRSRVSRDHPIALAVFGAAVAWSMFYGWVVSWMLLDDDDGLSAGARRLWIISLILMNMVAGVAYIFSRHIRRRAAG